MTERVALTPEAIEAVAARVVELLHEDHALPEPHRLVDAATLGRLLGVSRASVYEHAQELGAIRIGDGPRGRLRFDPATALTAWQDREPHAEPQPKQSAPRRRARTNSSAELLPIRGQEAA